MYKKILVPLDGSPAAECVLPHARILAQCFDAHLYLLHIVADPVFEPLFSGAKLASATHTGFVNACVQAQEYLDRLAAQLRRAGIAVSTAIGEGIIADTILQYEKQLHADLVVVASHGQSQPHTWHLGEVTYRIVHESEIPVLVIQAEQATTRLAQTDQTNREGAWYAEL